MPANRSAGRDVHLYNPDDLSKPLGGLVLTNGITNENFYAMVEVFVFFSSPYVLRHEDVTDGSRDIPRDEQPLQPGKYYVIAEGSFVINSERWLVRTISVATGTRVGSFRDAVRERNRRCVVTGKRALNAEYGSWSGFEAIGLCSASGISFSLEITFPTIYDLASSVCFHRKDWHLVEYLPIGPG